MGPHALPNREPRKGRNTSRGDHLGFAALRLSSSWQPIPRLTPWATDLPPLRGYRNSSSFVRCADSQVSFGAVARPSGRARGSAAAHCGKPPAFRLSPSFLNRGYASAARRSLGTPPWARAQFESPRKRPLRGLYSHPTRLLTFHLGLTRGSFVFDLLLEIHGLNFVGVHSVLGNHLIFRSQHRVMKSPLRTY